MNKIFNKFLIGFLFLFVFGVFYLTQNASAYTSSFSYTASIQTSSGALTTCNIKGMIGIDKTVYTPGETIVASARVDSFDCDPHVYSWSAFDIKGKNNGVTQTILSNASYQPQIFGTTFTKNFTASVASVSYHMDFDIDGFVDGNGGVMAAPGIGYVVNAPTPTPTPIVTVTITANGSAVSKTVNHGDAVSIVWSSTGATSCTKNFGGTGTTSGQYDYTANSAIPTQTFTVTCTT